MSDKYRMVLLDEKAIPSLRNEAELIVLRSRRLREVICRGRKSEYFQAEVNKTIILLLDEMNMNFEDIVIKAWSEDITETITDNGTYVTISLSIGLIVKIDKDDFERTKSKKWHLKKSKGNKVYVASSQWKGRTIYMHRFIMRCPKDKEVHHINGDGLDNRKSNLEVIDHRENMSRNRHRRKK